MTVRVGINGFGRIGRNFFRAVKASGADIEIVATNDLMDNKTLAHLLKYDSILGRFPGEVTYDDTSLTVDGQTVRVFAERDPAKIDWSGVGADVVVESTGFFTDATAARAHIDGGAKKVIISAPAKNEDITIVMGVNDDLYDPAAHTIISNASCTTNCLGPDGEGAERRVRHREGSDDDDPRLHARPEPAGRAPQGPPPRACRRPEHRAHLDRRREGDRPGAASAEGQARRLRHAGARYPPVRPPTSPSRPGARPRPTRSTPRFKAAAEGPLKGYLVYTEDPIVSKDIETHPASCIFDSGLTKVIGNQVKVVGWYDNEWGYSNRLVDIVALVGASL